MWPSRPTPPRPGMGGGGSDLAMRRLVDRPPRLFRVSAEFRFSGPRKEFWRDAKKVGRTVYSDASQGLVDARPGGRFQPQREVQSLTTVHLTHRFFSLFELIKFQISK